MRVVDLIEKKRDGGRLGEREIRELLERYTLEKIPDYQMSALLMAIYLQGFEPEELRAWTEGMLYSGQVLDLSAIPGIKVDKHSTGGVGDKISLPLAPLVAACGVPVPMISGRGLGHTGGTLDKLESIPGFSTQQSSARFQELIATVGLGLIGQTAEIAPADKKLYALRDVTGTVPSIPLITSSIMSKKLAEGLDALVLDVKLGSGAFMKSEEGARALARAMVEVGQRMGKRVVALLTDMSQPLGQAVGNALEVRESIEILKGRGPQDCRILTLRLAELMLELGGKDPAEAQRALDDGRGLAKFAEIIEAQGGDPRVIEEPERFPSASKRSSFCASKGGYLQSVDCKGVGLAALDLGAGRQRKEDDVDPAVGLWIKKRLGDWVEPGESILEIHHNQRGLESALERLETAYEIGAEAPTLPPLILDRIG